MKRTSLTDPQLESLFTRDEDTFFDRKSRRIAPGTLAPTLSAFANTDGGELVVGIEDDGSWDGFSAVEDANDLVAVAALWSTQPWVLAPPSIVDAEA